ncbi:hypothetical protein [Clostridium kluyveri]|uniref:Rho termination factor N-terminal domain-containing protein n=1 Tax=Clostridium kluyveri TaxID=1534 RepID=A0A1L5FC08_CLOKL|nr:hypothetical protein [Clostridium kluyveri]APM40551.1 hypothetical protein BS101_18375 [Clostridium kluyveri]
MYRLKKSNIERVVLSETARDDLLSSGFELLVSKKEESGNVKPLEEMTIEELRDYAKEKAIDVGKSTSISGILEKIKEHEIE